MEDNWIKEVCNEWLTEEEEKELVTLEYIVSQGYSKDIEADTKRYRELSDRRWKTFVETRLDT